MAITDLPTPLVVCDAGPLIHLDELGSVDLLADFSEVLVPEAVFGEVLKHRPGALDHRALPFRRVWPSAPEPPALEAQVLSLHTGEREALRVALEYRPELRLTDDTAGGSQRTIWALSLTRPSASLCVPSGGGSEQSRSFSPFCGHCPPGPRCI